MEEKNEITDKKMVEKLWDDFVFSLSDSKIQDTETKSISQSVVHLAKKLSEQAKEKKRTTEVQLLII